ncbi:hypothetical protein [Acinetobacter baumannii]
MENLKQLLNERFSRDDLKEYGVFFEVNEDNDAELTLSYKGVIFLIKTREENFDDWISTAKLYNSNKENFILDSSSIYLSDINQSTIEFRLKVLKAINNSISFSNVQEYKFNTEMGVIKIGYLTKK